MDETILLSPKDQEKIITQTEKLEVLGGLLVIEGSADKKEYLLKERITTIGKDDSALVRLKGLFAPKVAALINRRKEGYFITPSGGKDIKVNGNKVDQRCDLKDGDVIEVAGLKMQFFVKE
jgi:pSer/pThr/pTyr-binding forkhead associated (FHA) protein